MYDKDLTWTPEQEESLIQRILSLTNEQIMNLFEKVGIEYLEDEETIIKAIRKDKEDSSELDTLLSEADTKENLLKWISYYEKQ